VLRAVTYLLLAQIIFSLGIKVYSVIDWKINQDMITEKYCENKDKPMMNCNGKCYLAKQLEKLEQQESEERQEYPNPTKKVESTNFEWISEETDFTLVFAQTSDDQKMGEWIKTLDSNPHLTPLFTPPKV